MTEKNPLITDRYQRLRLLGEGGTGQVWLAAHPALDRREALKRIEIPADLSPGVRDRLRERIHRETKAAGRMTHENVVPVYDAFIEDGACWISMEYVEGPTVASLIRENPLDPAEAARIGLDVVRALEYCHGMGVVHRDVKPSSILNRLPDPGREDDEPRARLTDFGIAHLDDEPATTSLGRVMGTPAYRSPEQLHGGPVTGATDLWSLGATLFHMVEGRPPFGTSYEKVLAQVAGRRRVRCARSPEFTPVVRALLRRDPEKRASLDDTAARLAAILAARTADPVSAPLDRRKVLVAGATAVGAVLTAGGASVLIDRGRSGGTAPGDTTSSAPPPPGVPGRSYAGLRQIAEIPALEFAGRGVAFSRNGRAFAVAGGEGLRARAWNTTTRKAIPGLRRHSAWVWAVEYSPDGRLLAIGGGAEIRLLDATTLGRVRTLRTGSGVRSLAFSADSGTLVSGDDLGEAAVFRVGDGVRLNLTRGIGGHPGYSQVAVHPTERLYATSAGPVVDLRSLATYRVTGRPLSGHTKAVRAIEFSPDGSLVATASEDHTVGLWHVATRRRVRTLRHAGVVHDLAFSPDGATLATACGEGPVRLFAAASGTELGGLDVPDATAVAFHPRAAMLAVTTYRDRTVRLFGKER
ncbi:serine/threonine protein kinase [Actinocorallia herbida]|uniref:non-specific serine/threonine protein kinase n=1 Tax=Actinocorallia herbida TaxID=58109 RepID=A0A3N1D4F5_9ACTN|nr:serine/threonine-protein kinase [Actinocorallia herbida]ROO88411.1 serine/threonine protein kinase [Actinocorallia herbida]